MKSVGMDNTDKPCVIGATGDLSDDFEGQISTWKNDPSNLPCFRCLFPKKPNDIDIQNCSNTGVLGSVGGFLGGFAGYKFQK